MSTNQEFRVPQMAEKIVEEKITLSGIIILIYHWRIIHYLAVRLVLDT